MLVRREEGDHSVDCLCRVDRMKSRKYQVTRICRHQRDLHRQRVTDLSDEDDVGILPEDVPERFVKRRCIAAPCPVHEMGI